MEINAMSSPSKQINREAGQSEEPYYHAGKGTPLLFANEERQKKDRVELEGRCECHADPRGCGPVSF